MRYFTSQFWVDLQFILYRQKCYVKIEFQNLHNILEPIAAPAKKEESSSDDDSDSDDEVVEKLENVADKVEELVEKVKEKVDKGDVVEKVVVDNVITKVEQVVDNVNEVIQMEETPKVEGMLDQKT